jgi:uncharacterized membrane protein (UPF0127 family)
VQISRTIIIPVFILLFAAVILNLTYRSQATSPKVYTSFYLNGKSYNITAIAVTEAQQIHGLMNTTISNSTIMLFEFPVLGIYPFWMYDTYSNLDMLWLNASGGSGTVVYIESNATSCLVLAKCLNQTYTPNALANYVIEAKAGFVQRNGISVGDKITLK